MFDKIVFKQVQAFINKNDILDTHQSGYREGFSTETALIKVIDDLKQALDRKELSILVLLDFSKAFDKVDHILLVSILKSLSLSDNVTGWFKDYLTERKLVVKMEERTAAGSMLRRGIPQGSTLSALLFSLFINRLSESIHFCKYMLYADDVQIYLHGTQAEIYEMVNKVNSDLQTISIWCNEHGLSLNLNKCQAMLIGNSRVTDKVKEFGLPRVTLNDVALPYVKSVKSLGVIIEDTLKWDKQVQNVCRKVSFAIYRLRNCPIPLSQSLRKILAQSLIQPQLNYCSSVYGTLNKTLTAKLQRSQNAAVRYIYSLAWDSEITKYYIALQWLKVDDQRILNILKMTNKTLTTRTPAYLFKMLHDWTRSVPYSTRLLSDFMIPKFRTNTYKSSFTVTALRLKNKYKALQLTSASYKEFNRLLKENLMIKYYPNQ